MKNLLNKYKQYLLANKRSLTYYDYLIVYFKWLEKNNLIEQGMTKDIITQYFSENNFAKNTINLYIKSGKHFCKIYDIQNEWDKFPQLTPSKKIPDYLTVSDIQKAKDYIIQFHTNKNRTPEKIKAVIDFLSDTMLRRTEFINLKRKDINLEKCNAKVLGKGDKERLVYFTKETKEEIETYFNLCEEKQNAFNITDNQFYYLIKLMGKALDRRVYPHIIRHSFARHLILKGVPINIVSKLLGHTNLVTTQIYTDPDDRMIAEAWKQYDN